MKSSLSVIRSVRRAPRYELTVDHVLNLHRRKLADGVADGDVCSTSRSLLGGSDLQDAVHVDFEDNFKDSLTSLHGRNWCKSELAEGCVVFAVDTFTLEDRELYWKRLALSAIDVRKRLARLLVISHCCESSIDNQC